MLYAVKYSKEKKEEKKMKCEHCGYEGLKNTFRYLYNNTLDAETAYRECSKCFGWVVCNELEGEKKEKSMVR